jgi:hypothetical protein
MKLCKKCQTNKQLICFYKDDGNRDGLRNVCKQCKAAEYDGDKARRIELNNSNYYKCRTRILLRRKNNYMQHAEKYKKRTSCYRELNASKYNNYSSKRRAAKLNAMPHWLTAEHLEEIEEFYLLAKELAWLNQDGQPFHVDHIIPLQGVEICGLHVPWNLQLLPASHNLKKGNKLV